LEITSDNIIEIIAVITSLLYTFLAGRNKIIGWLFAIISSSLYVYINLKVQLYFFSLLHFSYVLIAVYGWFEWRKDRHGKTFRFYGWKNIPVIILGTVLTFILAFLAEKYTVQRLAYLDAANFIFCLIASYMISKKIMESWIYLFIIDIVCIYIYLQTGLKNSAILFLFLTVLAANAFWDWWKQYKANKTQAQ